MFFYNNNNQKNNKQPSDDYQAQFLLFCAVMIILYMNKDRILFWFYQNRYYIAFFTVLLVTGIYQYWIYRWRKNNPEKYQRKLNIESMKYRHLQNENGDFIRNPERIFIGKTFQDRKGLSITNKQRTGHVQIVGATGRGKTESVILPWFLQDALNGHNAILIDGKGDLELSHRLKEALNSHKDFNGRIITFDLDHQYSDCVINPLEGGNFLEISERIIASLEFESTYYKNVQQQSLLMILQLMEATQEPITFSRIYEYLIDGTIFSELVRKAKLDHGSLRTEIQRFESLSIKDKEDRLSGLISQLRPLATGDLAKTINGKKSDSNYLSLNEIINSTSDIQRCLVVGLNTMRFQVSAKIVGQIILQGLSWSTARRKQGASFTPIYLDEFSAFVYSGFEQFLNKSRSYNIALHLSHQSLGDLEQINPHFFKIVNVNTNMKCFLGLNDPDTADYFAKHIGTKKTTKHTERGRSGFFGNIDRTGEMSLRDVEEYKISPNRLRNYTQGQGVISLLTTEGKPFSEEVQFCKMSDLL